MSKSNIIRHIENIFTENINDESKKLLLESDIIFMDAGDHTGKTYENFLISFLRKNNYKGLVIWDDIFLNNDMIDVWNSIPNNEKINITNIGHYCGTGLWIMNKNIQLSI